MSSDSSLSPHSTAALLDEVAAMIDAHVATQVGLRALEDRQLGAIATVARRVRQQVEAGRPLDEALAQHVAPPVRAALRAGIASGQPAEALRQLALYLRRQSDFRHRMLWVMIYPLMVVLIGYALLVTSLGQLVGGEGIALIAVEVWPLPLRRFAEWIVQYYYLPPLLLLVGLLAWWRLPMVRTWLPRRCQPGRWGRMALFCDIAALQLKWGVPADEALRWAAQSCGDAPLQRSMQHWETAWRRGAAVPPLAAAPPLLQWTLASTGLRGERGDGESLRKLGALYRERERATRDILARFLPSAVVVVVGGGMAVAYIFAFIVPIYETMIQWSSAL